MIFKQSFRHRFLCRRGNVIIKVLRTFVDRNTVQPFQSLTGRRKQIREIGIVPHLLPELGNPFLVFFHLFCQRNPASYNPHGWLFCDVICQRMFSADRHTQMNGRIGLQRNLRFSRHSRRHSMHALKCAVKSCWRSISVFQSDLHDSLSGSLNLKSSLGHSPAANIFRRRNSYYISKQALEITGRTACNTRCLFIGDLSVQMCFYICDGIVKLFQPFHHPVLLSHSLYRRLFFFSSLFLSKNVKRLFLK